MLLKIRVILDVSNDVFRDIVIPRDLNLEELHFVIAKSFGFKGQEMAAFYRTDNDWNQGEEIPLFNMSDDLTSKDMKGFATDELLKVKGDKLIYVYDFLDMWAFYIDVLSEIEEYNKEVPSISLSFGVVPENAPEKKFTSDDLMDDPFNISSEDFIDLDEADLENY